MNIEKIIAIVRETDSIFFNDDLRADVSVKGAFDFVTKADTGISEYLKKRLTAEFPDVGFFSEESDDIPDMGKDYWILDPIDGTTNFMHALPYCAVSLGLCSGGEVVFGAVYIPYTGELFHAVKGDGAYLNGKPIHCSSAENLSDCVGFYEFNAYFKSACEKSLEYAKRVYLSCQGLRCIGSIAVELAYVACGRADVFFGMRAKPWDYAAGMLILTEAGGKFEAFGEKLDLARLNTDILASNGIVHDEFLKLMKE